MFLKRGGFWGRLPIKASVDFRVEAVDFAQTGQGNELDAFGVARFEAHRGPGGNVQPKTPARDAIESLSSAGARLVGVSFGNPYVASDLPGLATYIAAYGDQPVMQVAVARAIFGESVISGRLPVTIAGVAERGAGISRDRKR